MVKGRHARRHGGRGAAREAKLAVAAQAPGPDLVFPAEPAAAGGAEHGAVWRDALGRDVDAEPPRHAHTEGMGAAGGDACHAQLHEGHDALRVGAQQHVRLAQGRAPAPREAKAGRIKRHRVLGAARAVVAWGVSNGATPARHGRNGARRTNPQATLFTRMWSSMMTSRGSGTGSPMSPSPHCHKARVFIHGFALLVPTDLAVGIVAPRVHLPRGGDNLATHP